MERKVIGRVSSVVEFLLYEGDVMVREGGWNDFVYEEAGITKSGNLGVCKRPCKTISSKVTLTGPVQP